MKKGVEHIRHVQHLFKFQISNFRFEFWNLKSEILYSATKSIDTELTQCRTFLGVKRSPLNTCPRDRKSVV